MNTFKNLFNYAKVGLLGVLKVAEAAKIKTFADAGIKEGDLRLENGFTKKELINLAKHELVHDYLYRIAARYGWSMDEVDDVIPALVVLYKKVNKFWKQNRARRRS